jgi:uncharacterized membrane protein
VTSLPYDERPRSTAQHPLHPTLVPVPIVCFVGTLLTDIMYSVTAEMMWADFSAWLLVVGVTTGILAAIAGLVDLLSSRVIRSLPAAPLHALGNVVVLVLAFFNALIAMRGPR